MDRRILSLLQLCDSNFPSGAFSHSFGLETYIQEETVHSKESFELWLIAYLEKQLLYTDGLACRLTYEALVAGHHQEIWFLDQILTVQNLPREAREASRRMGERMIRLGLDLFSLPLLAEYQQKVREKKSYGHPALVFAIIAFTLEIPQKSALLSFLYSSLATLVQNGMRAIPLGQTDGQHLLLALHPYIEKACEKIDLLNTGDLGIAAPGLEIAQMRHERLHVRLFMS